MAGVDLGYDTDGLRQGGREALAAALARSRDAHVALAEQVHADHVDLDARTGQAAGAGDGLTASSAAVARTGAPR